MPKNNSSASRSEITPEGKPSSSFVTESMKSGTLGDNPVSVAEVDQPANESSKDRIMEGMEKKSVSFDGVTETMPQGKPSSSFINTSAVK